MFPFCTFPRRIWREFNQTGDNTMSIYKRGPWWWYRFKFQGALICESTKSKNKEFAKRMESDHFAKLAENRAGLKRIAKPIKFSAAVKEFMELKKPKWAQKTREIHNNSLLHLSPIFGGKYLSDISALDISRYQTIRQEEKASNRTINIEVSLVRMVLHKHKKWAEIAYDVAMLEENKDIGRELTEKEQDKLLAVAKASVSRSLYPAILTSIHTGLRSQELRLLRWHQVDLKDGSITVGKSKTIGGKGRFIPLSQTALNVLKDWRSQFPNAQPTHAVFPRESYGLFGTKGQTGKGGVVKPYKTFPEQPIRSFNTAWKTAKKVANVECRWHDLRHSFVSRIAAGGATDGTIQAIAGWMSPKMIKTYNHIRNEAMRKAVAVFDSVDTKSKTKRKK
jgi:integrase